MRHRDRRVAAIAVLAAAAACTSSTPPPEPQRSPSPRVPSCVTDADCSAGEECRDGLCQRPGIEATLEPVGCPEGCPDGEVCADDVCVGKIVDAGRDEPCGGCPEGWGCEDDTGLCRPSVGLLIEVYGERRP